MDGLHLTLYNKTEYDECGICGKSHKIENCNFFDHGLNHVKDTPTLSYALLSLPQGLEVKNFIDEKSVFAVQPFAKGVQFGPFIAKTSSLMDMRIDFPIKVFINEEEAVYLETYEETFCNWMCLVNAANNYEEQNLICYQSKNSIYFCSTREIKANEELKVGYALHYAKKMGLSPFTKTRHTIHSSDEEFQQIYKSLQNETSLQNSFGRRIDKKKPLDMTVIEENYHHSIVSTRKLPGGKKPKEWSCDQCSQVEHTVEEFAKHLMSHNKKLSPSFTCPYCSKKFRKNGYNRTIHISTCKSNPNKSQKENDVLTKPDSISLKEIDTKLITVKDTNELENQGWNEEKVSDVTRNCIGVETVAENVKSQLNTPILDLSDDIDFNIITSECELEKHILDSKVEKNGDFDFEFPSSLSIDSQVPIDSSSFYSGRDSPSFTHGCFSTCVDVTDEEKENMLDILILQGTQGLSDCVATEGSRLENSYSHFDLVKGKEEEVTAKENSKTQKTGEFKCAICYKRFCDVKYLYRHLRKHTGEFGCNACGKVFGRKENLLQHMKICKVETSAQTKWICQICKMKFEDLDSLHTHIRIHYCEGTEWVCCCGISSDNLDILISHECTLKKEITCKGCHKSFVTVETFMEHKEQPSKKLYKARPKVEILCEICGALNYSRSALRTHKTTHEEKRFECSGCSRKFARKDTLQQHMLVHGEYQWECNMCLKTFSRKKSLHNHQLVCQPNILDCMYCDKIFKSKSSLTRHMKLHVPSLVSRCKFCLKNFDNDTLDKHISEAHSDIPLLSCSFCKKQFYQHRDLHRHVRFQHKESYKCLFCGMTISYRHSLKKHLLSKHKDRENEWNSTEALKAMAVISENFTKDEVSKPKNQKGKHKGEGDMVHKKDLKQASVANSNYVLQQGVNLMIYDEVPSTDTLSNDKISKPRSQKGKYDEEGAMVPEQDPKQESVANTNYIIQPGVNLMIYDEAPNSDKVGNVPDAENNEESIISSENNKDYASSRVITLSDLESLYASGQIEVLGSTTEEVVLSTPVSLTGNSQLETNQSLIIEDDQIVNLNLDYIEESNIRQEEVNFTSIDLPGVSNNSQPTPTNQAVLTLSEGLFLHSDELGNGSYIYIVSNSSKPS